MDGKEGKCSQIKEKLIEKNKNKNKFLILISIDKKILNHLRNSKKNK